jgi:predicted metalloprotease with PDZ domain
MSLSRCRRGVTVAALTLAAVLAAPTPARAQPPVVNMSIEFDATEAPRKFLQARMHIPARPGPLTLYYPKWIPGEHGPTGPITDLAGIKISAAGKPVAWHRDEVDMYAIHCQVPAGAEGIDVALNFLLPAAQAGFSAGASATANLAALNWNQVLLYPKGPPARNIRCRPSVRVPAGWKVGSALTVVKSEGAVTEFAPVSLETLVDSPVLCGVHLREVPLVAADGLPHSVVLVCDSAAGLEMSPQLKENLDRLVVEAGKLFGARHYKQYKFLVTLSDRVAQFGLEHHECSDDRMPERILLHDQIKKGGWAALLPHEYVHSWNGKYRRPADMVTSDFQQPQRTKLLWVYEGLTQYLGVVLTARAGLWTEQQFRDNLAQIASWAQNQRGRTWRPLEDTTVAAQLLYNARGDWAAWRRSVDFYDEGVLLWLEVDTIIRNKTKGQKSLNDFCRRFHGGKSGPPELKPFTFDEMVADLDAVVAHDWKGLLEKRLTGTGERAPLEGIEKGGWKLGYAAKPSDLHTTRESDDRVIDLTAAIGLLLRDDAQVADVVPGSVAHKAGVGPGMRVIAVNGRRFTATGLREALAATSGGKQKVELLVENGDFYRTLPLDYRDGERYPMLERGAGMDLLAAICAPGAK